MDDVSDDAAMQAYYALDKERDRLSSGVGRLEYERTLEVIDRTLPEPPASIADIGGGPGRYTDWLIDAGYRVFHRDIVEHHVDQIGERHGDAVDAAVADARNLDLADAAVDAVLLLGPLYHLRDDNDRVQCLREAARVVRPGGRVYAAAISRWAGRVHGMLVMRTHEFFPQILDEIDEMERTGWMRPLFHGSFTGYAHRPAQLRDEVATAGLELESLVNLEGVGATLGDADVDARLDDPHERESLLAILRSVESVPELLGTGPHLLAVARRPV
jgi:SAM-dependent methyltransferase